MTVIVAPGLFASADSSSIDHLPSLVELKAVTAPSVLAWAGATVPVVQTQTDLPASAQDLAELRFFARGLKLFVLRFDDLRELLHQFAFKAFAAFGLRMFGIPHMQIVFAFHWKSRSSTGSLIQV